MRKALRFLSAALSVSLAAYVGAFAWHFEVFGAPVRNNSHGWLGPVRRGDSHIVDVGKVYDYEGADVSSYRTFRPLCGLWLWAMGLDERERR